MLYRSSLSLSLCRLLGLVCALAAVLGVLGVLSTSLFGVQGNPAWLYFYVWPHATQLLIGAMICSLMAVVLLLYPAHKSPAEASSYELW